uniref:Uncharacterized protein n=1 Tax=Knipowitschia caucasica TaxID=637954 RepID=A0AAV2JAQ5_KNICA
MTRRHAASLTCVDSRTTQGFGQIDYGVFFATGGIVHSVRSDNPSCPSLAASAEGEMTFYAAHQANLSTL